MSIANLLTKQIGRVALTTACTISGLTLGLNPAFAGPREQARFIHDRIAGVPPTNSVLNSMTTDISGGNITSAVNTAMANSNFLNVTVKNMVIPWTNKEQTVFAPLNDAAATIIGYIRDGKDFRGIMFDNTIYVGNDNTLPAYSNSNNNHYAQMEHRNLDLASVLLEQPQTNVTGLPGEAVAGVTTTRQSARAFFYAGTNRAMFRFTLMNYMCLDLEQVKDITRIPDRIRQDPSRSPGGDSDVYLNNCLGCHAGLDALAGAYAYYEWQYPQNGDPDTGFLRYNLTAETYDLEGNSITSRVSRKHLINPTNFIYGYVTSDDSWKNYWRTGVNANLQWGQDSSLTPANSPQAAVSGNGAAALGREMANTGAFARCQVVKVYRHVCHADPDETTLQTLVGNFAGANYDMRTVFRDSVTDCMNKNPNI